MDSRIENLRRRVKADPDNILDLEALERLFRNAKRFEDALTARILIRFRKGEITLKQICIAAKLNYKAAQNLCPQEKLDLSWSLDTKKQLMYALDNRDLVLFSYDCVERALHFYKAVYPKDTRPGNVVRVARTSNNILKITNAVNAADMALAEAAEAAHNASASGSYPAAHAAWTSAYAAYSLGYVALHTAKIKRAHAVYSAANSLSFAASVHRAGKRKEIAWQQNRLAEYLVGEA